MLHSILLLLPVVQPTTDSTWTSPLMEPLFLQEEATPAADENPDAAPEPKPTAWEGTVAINASQSYGNSDISAAGVNIDATREHKKDDGVNVDDRWTFAGAINYNENTQGSGDTEVTVLQRRRSADLQYDKFLSPKSYLLAQTGIADDTEASLDGRWTVGIGYGYQFRDTEIWKISSEAGVSYVNEDYTTTNSEDFTALRLAYSVEWTGSKKWSWSHAGEVFPSTDGMGDKDQDIYGKFDTRVKMNLTESMFAQLQSLVDYDNTPSTDATGKELDRIDHLLLLSVGWSF